MPSAKQARRDRRLREASRGAPAVTVREVRTADDVRDALSVMLPQPKTGDWRPDVIGVDNLSLQAGYDGWPLINGHRATKEMCAALQADRPEQAGDFILEDLGGDGPGDGTAGPQRPRRGAYRHGRRLLGPLDHEDGSMSCSLGLDCLGFALPHAGWTDCRSYGPCTHCDGPPVRWECDQQGR